MTIKRINPPSLFNSLQYGFSQVVETTGTGSYFCQDRSALIIMK